MDSKGKDLNKGQENELSIELSCRICGCTDSKPCEGGCEWLRFEEILHGTPDICSKCITDKVPECLELLIKLLMEHRLEEIRPSTITGPVVPALKLM